MKNTGLGFTVHLQIGQTPWLPGAIGLFLLFAIGYVLFWQYRQHQKRLSRLSGQRIQLLNSAINSHFIYNALNSIRFYIYVKKNEQAGDMLDAFAYIIRNSVENSREIFIGLQKELEYAKNYVTVARLQYEVPIELHVHNGLGPIDPDVPFLLLQSLVENAVRHAHDPGPEPYIIRIDIRDLPGNTGFMVTVEDFGQTVTHPPFAGKDEVFYAPANIEERLKLLYPGRKSMASLRVTDKTLSGGSGHLVEVALPYDLPRKFRHTDMA